MSPDLIPAVDPTPIPAPEGAFHLLLILTFFLHAIFVNLALGGTLVAAVSQLLSRGREGDHRTVLAQRLMSINTYAISMAITTGVAPLLFVQVLYHQYFYTATILLGWGWLGLLGFLMLGYYSAYLYKFRGSPTRGSGGTGWLVVSALMFLAIAVVHVSVNLLHSQPALWTAAAENPWVVLADRAFVPRFLHFLLAALGFSALVAARWSAGRASRGHDVELESKITGTCWRWAMVSTLLQVLSGFYLLAVLPREVLSGLMKGGLATLLPLGVSLVFGLGLLMMLARSANPVDRPKLIGGTLAGMTLTIAIMSVTRHQVRTLYLAPYTDRFTMQTAPQWGNMVLFLLLLVAGLLTVAYMVRQVMTHPATDDDTA